MKRKKLIKYLREEAKSLAMGQANDSEYFEGQMDLYKELADKLEAGEFS